MSIWSQLLKQLNVSTSQQIRAIRVHSESVSSGDVFVAIRGGHQYIDRALDLGAQLVISEQYHPSERVYQVNDTIEWLGALAKLYRSQLSATVIGITGSVGKTGLTQLLRYTLSKHALTHSTADNENNELGVALTILSTPLQTKFLIVELGVAKPGDMDLIAPMVSPDIAIITKVGPSHLAQLKSAKGVWDEKSKLTDHAKQLILNKNCHYSALYQGAAQWVKPSSHDAQSVSYTFMSAVGKLLNLQLCGQGMRWPKSRMNVYQCHGTLIIDDSYNANYLSYLNAIRHIQKYEQKSLVVGEMGDMGDKSRYYHEMLAHFMCRYHFDDVIFYGKETKGMMVIYNGMCCHTMDKDLVRQKISEWVAQNKVILIKGSRHLELDKVCP